jgi:uncharacterized protein YndB with AHSA1/START domain
MSDLIIERHLAASPDKVFEYVTRSEHLVKWWGPEGVSLASHAMNFSETGPWFSVMQNAEGNTFKVSGVVTAVTPPQALELTWAWHDENDVRGHESTVRFEIHPADGGGTLLRLVQTGLQGDESALRHDEGWSSSFNKLEQLARS